MHSIFIGYSVSNEQVSRCDKKNLPKKARNMTECRSEICLLMAQYLLGNTFHKLILPDVEILAFLLQNPNKKMIYLNKFPYMQLIGHVIKRLHGLVSAQIPTRISNLLNNLLLLKLKKKS